MKGPIPPLNISEKLTARRKGGIYAIKEYRERCPDIPLQVVFRVVESYRDGFNEAMKLSQRSHD